MLLFAALTSVLVVWLDDISYDDWQGLAVPRLHRLESEGITFGRAYAMPLCSPTRFAGQFGEYGSRYGIGTIIRPEDTIGVVPDDVTSLAEVFGACGYRTLHAGKWHLSSAEVTGDDYRLQPNLHGYDDALAWSHGNLVADDFDGVSGHDYRRWIRYDNGEASLETTYATTAVVDAALDWWTSTDGPKFASVNLHAPHAPFHRPPVALLGPGYPPTPTDRERFEAMLFAADVEIGRLLDAVDLARTYVFVIGDNGTPKGVAHKRGFSKGTSTEGGIRVPLFVRGPGIAAGSTSDALVHVVDLRATLADLCGLTEPGGGDGVSFAAAALGSPGDGLRTWVYTELFAPNGLSMPERRERALTTLDGWKLVVLDRRRDAPDGGGEPTLVETTRLYRLPDEDHAVENAGHKATLRALLDGAVGGR
jgi:arylsulfatase A-like enzyme